MSLRAISEKLTVQNKLFVDFTDEQYQKNSDRVQDSFDGLNKNVSSISSFLKGEKKEESTDESRERLREKDNESDTETQSKGLFGGLLNSDNKKSSGGLLGGIFSTALGILVKSLPLIGLASIFFSDVIAGLFTAVFKDPDAGAMVQRLITGALVGLFFGRKGALVFGVLNAILDEDSKDSLKDMATTLKNNENVQSLIQSFIESLNNLVISVADIVSGDFAFNVESIKGVLKSLAIVAAPFAAVAGAKFLAKKAFKKGASLLGSGKDKVVNVLKKGSTAGVASAAKSVRGIPAAARAGLLAGSLRLGVMTGGRAAGATSGAVNAVKGVGSAIASGASAAGSSIKSGASTAAAATGSIAKTVGKKATLGAVVKAIPGLSILAGVGFGLNALKDGDPVAAGLHIASGIVGTIPGLGTAASFALTGAVTARETGMLGGVGDSDIKVEVNGKSESLSDATRERDELVAKTSSNVIMDNSTTNNVSSGGGSSISMSGPISWHDNHDPYLGHV